MPSSLHGTTDARPLHSGLAHGPALAQPYSAPGGRPPPVRAWHLMRCPPRHARTSRRGPRAAGGYARGPRCGDWVDAVDWWYEVQLPGGWPGDEQVVVLEADGIDDRCAVWLDDRLLTTHAGGEAAGGRPLPAGQHGRAAHACHPHLGRALPRLPNPPLAPPHPPRQADRHDGRVLPGSHGDPPRRSASPGLRAMLGTGIWDDIRLVTCCGAHIEDAYAAPGRSPRRTSSLSAGRCGRHGSSSPKHLSRLRSKSARAMSGTRYDEMVAMLRRSSWRSNRHPSGAGGRDQGEPYLCRVTVRLLDARGEVLDEAGVTTGVRTVRRERLAGGRTVALHRQRPAGLPARANWTPAMSCRGP